MSYTFIQGLYLQDGQSMGKKITKIKVVDHKTGKNKGFAHNLLIRGFLYISVPTLIMPFYYYVDALFVFRKDKRCIHDLVSGTCVVEE